MARLPKRAEGADSNGDGTVLARGRGARERLPRPGGDRTPLLGVRGGRLKRAMAALEQELRVAPQHRTLQRTRAEASRKVSWRRWAAMLQMPGRLVRAHADRPTEDQAGPGRRQCVVT